MDKVQPKSSDLLVWTQPSNDDGNQSTDSNSNITVVFNESNNANVNANGVSRLTPELIMRAEIEVNEKDEWRLRDIEALREIIRGEPSIRCRLDDGFLLRFLRARRFDYDGAFRLICDYYQLYRVNPELFLSLDQLKCVFDSNTIMICDGKSNNDETIFFLRLGQWNPRKFSFDHIISAAMISMEYAIQDEVTQINGIICVIDMSGFGWNQLKKFGPGNAKKVIHILDNCLPIRIKTIYVINESTLADIGFAIMRPFIHEELHEKIVFLGTNFNSILHKVISPEILPEEFGGLKGPMNSEICFNHLCPFENEMKHNFSEFGFIITNQSNYDYRANNDNGINGGDAGVVDGGKCGPATSALVFCRGNRNANSGNGFSNLGNYPHHLGHLNHHHGTDMRTLFRKSQTCNGYLFDYYNTSTSVD